MAFSHLKLDLSWKYFSEHPIKTLVSKLPKKNTKREKEFPLSHVKSLESALITYAN